MAKTAYIPVTPIMSRLQFRHYLDRGVNGRRYYVYVVYADGIPFYVGKGVRKVGYYRAINHEAEANCGGRGSCASAIRRHLRRGAKIGYSLHFDSNYEAPAYFEEQVLITQIGKLCDGGTLVNVTRGGSGLSGYTLSHTTRKKMSESRTGMRMSKKWCRSISEGRKTSLLVKAENERRKIPLIAAGVSYASAGEAAIALSCTAQTIRYRIETNKPGYRWK